MTVNCANDSDTERPLIARKIHAFAAPIILGWLAICVALTVFVPSLEKVEQQRAVSLSPQDAPSFQAVKRIGQVFHEGNSDSSAMIVLEGDQPLDDAVHKYYAALLRKLKADKKHVEHVQDFWGDPLTAAGAQSDDGKAVTVQLSLGGNRGESLANESVEAVRKIAAETPAPPGIKTYITGPSALMVDMQRSGDKSMLKITLTTVTVIFFMLLLVYRSVSTVIALLSMVGVALTASRGIVALIGHSGGIGLTTFAVTLLTSLTIAAGTDYGIFVFGRYHEARLVGEDEETAFYTMYRGTIHVILGTGLTIAAATLCLLFARLPSFQTLAIPCAVGTLVTVAVALTLTPAVLVIGSRYGLFNPKRRLDVRRWRRVGTVVVRWPVPVLTATLAIALVGLLALPGLRINYNDRIYLPTGIPANQGYAAADRHFAPARMKPEILMIESDHDMRNPADFLILDKLAKGIFRVPGISRVQAITRPDGTTLAHTTIPYLISMQNAIQVPTLKFQRDRMKDMLSQAEEMDQMAVAMRRMYDAMAKLSDNTHRMANDFVEMDQIASEVRDHITDFDDFWRPIRSYFYWEKHCYDIPICWSFRSVFDALDGVDEIDEKIGALVSDVQTLDALLPQMLATFPPMIETIESMRTMMLTMHSTMVGIFDQMDEMSENANAMGKAFDTARNDDSFYLPPEIFQNKRFQRAMDSCLSADGHAARFIILHRGDPQTPDGMASVNAVRTAAEESLKGTPLEDAKIYLTGAAAVVKDIDEGAGWDLLIVGISAMCLIFIIVLILTRALIAAAVIVGTVVLSLGASFGLSVLLWQHILGFPLHYMVLTMSVIALLAVGSDYNLLLVARFKQELGAGLNTAIIRSMGGTGKVVTNAGLVFAVTMASMVVSDLRVIGQVGTTIALGLLFDTLIVRSFMTPAVAAQLGRWFWWPMRTRRHTLDG